MEGQDLGEEVLPGASLQDPKTRGVPSHLEPRDLLGEGSVILGVLGDRGPDHMRRQGVACLEVHSSISRHRYRIRKIPTCQAPRYKSPEISIALIAALSVILATEDFTGFPVFSAAFSSASKRRRRCWRPSTIRSSSSSVISIGSACSRRKSSSRLRDWASLS